MRKHCQFKQVEGDCGISNNSLVIAVLNVRSHLTAASYKLT